MPSLQTHVRNNTIHISQEVEATQMSIVGWMNKLSVVYTSMEYYSAWKREILSHDPTLMNLCK